MELSKDKLIPKYQFKTLTSQVNNSLHFNLFNIDNYSIGRGSVGFADYLGAILSFTNCTFLNNYAVQGGVFFVH
jgi:hypothetical protein